MRRFASALPLLWLALVGAACRSLPDLPPADLSAPGWRVQQGQAVWKPAKHRPELAGELLLAVHPRGDFLIQFTKTPFPLVAAQSAAGQWRIEFGRGDYVRRGRGAEPARFVWFQLPRFLAGARLDADWRGEGSAGEAWQLENRRTGETLAGYLSP